MNIRVFPTPLNGCLDVPASKSLSHRYLMGAALAHGISTLDNLLTADDLTASREALHALGIQTDGPTVWGGTWHTLDTTIHCRASGTTLRFMIPIAMHREALTTFTGSGRLPKRPLDVYERLFTPYGLYTKHGDDPLPVTVQGPLEPATYTVPGSVSSQFISGLLFVLPLLRGPSSLIIEGPLESAPYVALTLSVLDDFGIQIKRLEHGFEIPGNQTYRPLETTIEGDFSQAAFWLAAGAIGNRVALKGLREDSVQGDKAMVSYLQAMQADVSWQDTLLISQHAPLKALNVDLRDTPDLGPILMLLAGLAEGTSAFSGLRRLRLKESDRLGVMQALLNATGVRQTLHDDVLTITGQPQLRGNQRFKTYDDHRIAMTLCALAHRFDAPFIVEDIDVVHKSYPHFLDDYARLGGRFEIL